MHMHIILHLCIIKLASLVKDALQEFCVVGVNHTFSKLVAMQLQCLEKQPHNAVTSVPCDQLPVAEQGSLVTLWACSV